MDWSTPGSSTFGVAGQPNQTLSVAFDPLSCVSTGTRDCIPQPGTSEKLDSLGDRLMYRLQYRNFGSYQVLLANHTVDADGPGDHAGVRWYELRKPAAWSIFQQGTHAPDLDHRWMASVAMDGGGNIALGYSTSSSTLFPSIRYAGRMAGDPSGVVGGELTLQAGSGSQLHTSSRWGDYTMLAVDPTDDCSLWYTNEYYSSTDPMNPSNWKTRIGAFKFTSCSPPTSDVSITKADSVDPVTAGNNLTYTLMVDNLGPSYAPGVKVSDPLPSGVSFVSADQGGTYNATTNTISWFLGPVTVDQPSISLSLTVKVDPAKTGTIVNNAIVSSFTTDPNTSNNSTSETTAVQTSADLTITKSDSPDPVTAGSNLTYT
ncbi:MAG: DUF11 domain-containing protein, partial [Acidimicrobiia bacterium]